MRWQIARLQGFSILAAVQFLMPDLGVTRENTGVRLGHRLRRPFRTT
ncbi:MAG: hypothetical protein R2726_21195 [Acidimicrobiales bacterium]